MLFKRIKKIRYLLFITLTLFLIHSFNEVVAQSYIGVTGGLNKATFFDFSKDDAWYDSKYHLSNGQSISSFYEFKMDSVNNLKVELQYRFQKADIEVKYDAGHSSFYTNINYSFHQLNLNLDYVFSIIENRPISIAFLFGPSLSFVINTKSDGYGWGTKYETQIDTNGNPVQILTTRNWEKNESQAKDISQFNFGWDLGFELTIPVSNKLHLLIQNKYNIILTNILKLDDLKYTSLLIGYMNLGLRYNLTSKTK